MAKTVVENAQIEFRNQLAMLKNITGKDDEELALLLGCTSRTITKMRNEPFTVSGKYILLVQTYLKREEARRWI